VYIRVGNGAGAVAHPTHLATMLRFVEKKFVCIIIWLITPGVAPAGFCAHFVVDCVTRIFEKSVFTEIARDRQSGLRPGATLSDCRLPLP
jgi:hypothetical protein